LLVEFTATIILAIADPKICLLAIEAGAGEGIEKN
jgi:hypothetical protein